MIKNKRIKHLNIWKRRVLGTGILNLSATDIWDQIALSHGSHELQDAFQYSWLLPISIPYYDNERCLKTLMNVSVGTKLLPMEDHWLKGIIVINSGWGEKETIDYNGFLYRRY